MLGESSLIRLLNWTHCALEAFVVLPVNVGTLNTFDKSLFHMAELIKPYKHIAIYTVHHNAAQIAPVCL